MAVARAHLWESATFFPGTHEPTKGYLSVERPTARKSRRVSSFYARLRLPDISRYFCYDWLHNDTHCFVYCCIWRPSMS
jgi:hypothetical protein